jgi:hypothetical protein
MLQTIFGSPLDADVTAEGRTACAIDVRFLLLAFEIQLNRLETQLLSAAIHKRDLDES